MDAGSRSRRTSGTWQLRRRRARAIDPPTSLDEFRTRPPRHALQAQCALHRFVNCGTSNATRSRRRPSAQLPDNLRQQDRNHERIHDQDPDVGLRGRLRRPGDDGPPSAPRRPAAGRTCWKSTVEQSTSTSRRVITYTVGCKNNDLALDGMWRIPRPSIRTTTTPGDDLPGGSWSRPAQRPLIRLLGNWDGLRSVRPVKVARFCSTIRSLRLQVHAPGGRRLVDEAVGHLPGPGRLQRAQRQLADHRRRGDARHDQRADVEDAAVAVRYVAVQPSFDLNQR